MAAIVQELVACNGANKLIEPGHLKVLRTRAFSESDLVLFGELCNDSVACDPDDCKSDDATQINSDVPSLCNDLSDCNSPRSVHSRSFDLLSDVDCQNDVTSNWSSIRSNMSTAIQPPGSWCTPTCLPINMQMQTYMPMNGMIVPVIPMLVSVCQGFGSSEASSSVASSPMQPSAQTQCGPLHIQSADLWSCSDQRTTLVFKRIPEGLTRDGFHEVLDSLGFTGFYDFLYMPISFKKRKAIGYAIVNFVKNACAVQCLQSTIEGRLPAGITADWSSDCQGLHAHIERYRNSPVMHPDVPDDARPLIFIDGQSVAFPCPIQPIKLPNSNMRRGT